jgi:hypothetical protein
MVPQMTCLFVFFLGSVCHSLTSAADQFPVDL